MPARLNRYTQLIEHIFTSHFKAGAQEIPFKRCDLEKAAKALGIERPKNLGDVIYRFRYRGTLPASIQARAPSGHEWLIRSAGRGRYEFVAVTNAIISPDLMLSETKVPDATPGVVAMYALSDEQALLAKLRYNRLIDLLTGVTCYSLQSHLRTQVKGLGQVETDELYVGIDRRGAHYVFPVQAKGSRDNLSVVQIEQDFALCAARFPRLICRPIGAQFMSGDLIALFEFERTERGVAKLTEKHYRLVPPDQLSTDELETYRRRPIDGS
jgi:hypothetical protein